MNLNDRELGMLFGDLDENELQSALSSMPAAEKASFQNLKETLRELKRLREEVPQLQLSPERLRDAIHAAPAKKICAWWASRWTWGGLVAAACATAFLFMINSGGSSTISRTGEPVATNETTPIEAPSVTASDPISKPDPSTATVAQNEASGVNEVTSPTVTVSAPKPKPAVRKAPRTRYGGSYASNLSKRRNDLREGVSRPAIRTTEAPGAGTDAGTGPLTAMDVAPSVVPAEDAVVVVTSDLDSNSGANHAMEVSVKQNDVVLGS